MSNLGYVAHMSNIPPRQADTLIPTAEVAALLGVSTKTISRWAADGRLTPVFKAPGLRGALLFDRQTVDNYAKESRGQASA